MSMVEHFNVANTFTHTRSLVIAEAELLSVSSSPSAVDAEAVPPARLIRMTHSQSSASDKIKTRHYHFLSMVDLLMYYILVL